MAGVYTIKARLYPVILTCLPILILGITYSFEFKTYVHAVSSFGVVGALTYLLSQIGRDRGKRKEKGLWASSGGPPTTQILRIRDSLIDKYTKGRYYVKLQTLCPMPILPDQNMENTDPNKADEIYTSWANYLRTQTRDTKKFSLLFKENISYGFRRNLWGLKPFGLSITILSITGNYLYWAITEKSFIPNVFPDTFFISSGILAVVLLFWLIYCRKSWVKIPAFAYAERLIEATNHI